MLLVVSTGVLFYALGQIWFCQIVIYPLFARVGVGEYVDYHRFYGRRIPGPVIVPGLASFLLPIGLWWMPPPAAPPRIAALNALCGAVGLVITAAVLMPRHARLGTVGKNEHLIEQLVRYNWARTLSITASTVLTTVMLLGTVSASSLEASRMAAPSRVSEALTAWRAEVQHASSPRGPRGSTRCAETAQARLYFGLSGPEGPIPAAAWEAFLADTITPRFPDGLTVLEATGQWRGADHTVSREASRVVEIMHEPSPAAEAAIEEIADAYKTRYGQEAVMIVHSHSPVCLH